MGRSQLWPAVSVIGKRPGSQEEAVAEARTQFAIPLSLKPMEAEPIDKLPADKGWLFEPKYDGFRCIVFRVESP